MHKVFKIPTKEAVAQKVNLDVLLQHFILVEFKVR